LWQSDWAGQVAWLIPAALILLIAGLLLTMRKPRTDRTRVAFLMWGGWLVVTGAVFSFAQGIVHPYYAVALAPAIGALVGMGSVLLWRRRSSWFSRLCLGATLAVTSVVSYRLLLRSPDWHPTLRTLVLVVGLLAAGGIAFVPRLWKAAAIVFAGAGLVSALAGPTAYSLDTASTPHSGAIPSAGPAVTGGGGFGAGPIRNLTLPRGFTLPAIPGGPGAVGGAAPGGGFGQGPGRVPPGGAPGNQGGGFLSATKPAAALVSALKADASDYTWVAATVNSNSAAGYQLATGEPVMAVGGFNGTDPWPTLARFQEYVTAGRVHYYIAGAGGFGGGPAGAGASASTSSQITAWVESHFTAETIGGSTVYDLSSPS
jgi:4-amino-4-deoxy-L-arabinose transferase-like glycosyltransferase